MFTLCSRLRPDCTSRLARLSRRPALVVSATHATYTKPEKHEHEHFKYRHKRARNTTYHRGSRPAASTARVPPMHPAKRPRTRHDGHEKYDRYDRHEKTRYVPGSAPTGLPVIPDGFFAGSPVVIPAHAYIRTHTNPARYYLFEHRPPARRPGPSLRDAKTKTPPRPVAPMLNYVQILATPTADTPGTCLMVHHDNRRYLFGNIAEGTQRVFVQQKYSLARTEEIFLTGPVNWHTAGGLLGMVLTVAEVVQTARQAAIDEAKAKVAKMQRSTQKDADKALVRAHESLASTVAAAPRSLNIHGGTNLAHLLATARRFVFRKGLPIRPHEVRDDVSGDVAGAGTDLASFRDADWSDDNMMVWYVPVFAGSETVESEPTSRKRGFEALEGDVQTETTEQTTTDRALVDSVVKHMFDSDWKLDALTETTLHAARLPAKLFVKDAQGRLQAYTGPMPGDADGPDAADVPDVPVFVRQPWPGALIHALPHTTPARQSMCYVVRNHPQRGKVNAAEAKRLGAVGRDFRDLVAGQTVTTKDGTVITPDMVIGPTVEGASFAVVDLPDASYVDAFLAKPEWTNGGVMDALSTIFWLLGPGLAADTRLQAFMAKHARIRHTVSAKDVCANTLALASAASVQLKHHAVDAARFPVLQFDNAPAVALANRSDLVEPAQAGWSIRLAPQVLVEEHKVYPALNVTTSAHLDAAVRTAAADARARVATPAFQKAVAAGNRGLARPDVEVVPLGTGSAMPSKYRNVSATLVRVPGVGSYLFDAGENTLGSMRRLYGDARLADVLRELRCIWISHLHADHHLGTVSVIRAWRDATASTPTQRLMVASHVNMLHWLREYAEVDDFGLARVHQVELECHGFPRTRTCAPVVFGDAEAAEFGLDRIDACRVDHCHGALAVVFTWAPETFNSSPLKVAYSGDCRPSDDFVDIGQGATLLLHESTFDDELAGEALAKKHCTMAEAMDVGRRMGARRLLLTHFSQRYPKIPVFSADDRHADDADGEDKTMQVLIAFDQMCVKLADFKTAAAFLPAFQKLYEEEE